jgi:hypothetical protein
VGRILASVINHRGAQVTINPHIMKLVAAEKAADLRREAAPRPEATAKPASGRRQRKQAAKRRRPIGTPQLEDR